MTDIPHHDLQNRVENHEISYGGAVARLTFEYYTHIGPISEGKQSETKKTHREMLLLSSNLPVVLHESALSIRRAFNAH